MTQTLNSTFNVIVTGEGLNGSSREQVEAAFAKLFKLDPAQAAATLARAPLVVKRNLDAGNAVETAMRVAVILQTNVGAVFHACFCKCKL